MKIYIYLFIFMQHHSNSQANDMRISTPKEFIIYTGQIQAVSLITPCVTPLSLGRFNRSNSIKIWL